MMRCCHGNRDEGEKKVNMRFNAAYTYIKSKKLCLTLQE